MDNKLDDLLKDYGIIRGNSGIYSEEPIIELRQALTKLITEARIEELHRAWRHRGSIKESSYEEHRITALEKELE